MPRRRRSRPLTASASSVARSWCRPRSAPPLLPHRSWRPQAALRPRVPSQLPALLVRAPADVPHLPRRRHRRARCPHPWHGVSVSAAPGRQHNDDMQRQLQQVRQMALQQAQDRVFGRAAVNPPNAAANHAPAQAVIAPAAAPQQAPAAPIPTQVRMMLLAFCSPPKPVVPAPAPQPLQQQPQPPVSQAPAAAPAVAQFPPNFIPLVRSPG